MILSRQTEDSESSGNDQGEDVEMGDAQTEEEDMVVSDTGIERTRDSRAYSQWFRMSCLAAKTYPG